MARIQTLFLLIGALISLAAASSPQTFCKCTCFKNSTIIPLSSDPSANLLRRSPFLFSTDLDLPTTNPPSQFDTRENNNNNNKLAKRAPAACTACTKTFCRSHSLPFCHDATDDDITTDCFQRDSFTDRLIVWCFILGVLGLLGFAAFRKIRAAREARGGGALGLGLGFGRGGGGGGAGSGGAYSPLGQGN